jgi:hypothetical protein
MGHLLTTFYWSTSSFSGIGPLHEGPFFVGTLNKLFRAEVRGQVNYQASVVGPASVGVNSPAWGLQQVPHGSAANDPVTSTDDDTWLIRRQIGQDDYLTSWAPNTANANILAGSEVSDSWHGQLAIGAATDLFLSFKSSSGIAIGNMNTFGTIRIWWA